MIHRWFYIESTKIVPIGPLSMAKAKEYEEVEARLLYTVAGLDMLRDAINDVLRDPKNAKQLEREWK